MIIKIILSLIFFISCIGNANYAFARNNFSNDLGTWTAINVNMPVTEKVLTRFQISPRWLDNSSDFNQFILHSLLGYKFNEHFTFFQGYAWNTKYIPNFRREQRIYQEAIFLHDVKKISFEHRFRFEERFMQGVEGVTLRARYRLKGVYPLDRYEKWSVVLFDELFVNLNSHFDGPQAGIDQNRIYAGINRKLNKYMSVDLGYQLQQFHRPGPPKEVLNHFIFFYLNYFLPPLTN